MAHHPSIHYSLVCHTAPLRCTFRERFGLQARACDVWALGVTVFWCVFGILPYEGETLQVFHRMRTVEWSGRSCRLRCRAVQDTVLGALERRLGCSAARDTVSCGIPCRVGHFAMRAYRAVRDPSHATRVR